MIPASPCPATEQPENRKATIHVFSHGHATASAAEWPPISPKFQELIKFSTHACDNHPHPKSGASNCRQTSRVQDATRIYYQIVKEHFSAENQLNQTRPCGLKPIQTNICKGFKPQPAFDLQKPNTCGKWIGNLIGKAATRQATSSKKTKFPDHRLNRARKRLKMETTGLEPATSAVQGRRSPN